MQIWWGISDLLLCKALQSVVSAKLQASFYAHKTQTGIHKQSWQDIIM